MQGRPTCWVNGDSQTIGTDLSDDGASYAYHLVNRFGGSIIANPAIGGASIDRILRTTHQYLDDCETNRRGENFPALANNVDDAFPDFVIIGWTEYSRYDWFYEGKTRTMKAELDGLGPDETKLEKNMPRKTWQETSLIGDGEGGPTLIRYFYNQIMNLHSRLEHLKIPHLFLNAHAGFYDEYGVEHRKNTMATDLFEEFDWQNCFWNVFEREDASFTSWAGKRGYEHVPGWHYEHRAHIDFSKVLYDYVQEQDLLNMYKETTDE